MNTDRANQTDERTAATPDRTVHIQHGLILTPHGFVRGSLKHAGGRILAIEGTPVLEADAHPASATGPWVLPGFIDLHVHGGGGADTMAGGSALVTMSFS